MSVTICPQGTFSGLELNGLFATHHWDIPDADRLEASVRHSWHWVTAREAGGRLVGFVQAISDGLRHAYILKLIVHPEFRRQGIGTGLMESLMATIGEHRMLPTLVATPGNVPFYERFGFRTECKGLTAMCIR